MHLSHFTTPRRVWINTPSKLQPHHDHHGETGIGVFTKDRLGGHVTVYFTEGPILSMPVDPMYLSLSAGEYDTDANGWVVSSKVSP